MECNKDEAIRAKEIAERKFRSKDAVGAMKFSLKAQNLYPELDGVEQMISTLNIHIAAANKESGECDWYKILAVDPKADDETVRRQYRKLALSLHPDKNKSVGADEAFKLVSEAWTSILLDKAKRKAYEQKRNMKTFQKAPTPSGGGAPAPPRANGFHKSSNNASSSARTDQNNGRAGQHYHKQKPNTFWTVCHRCKTQYEYLRVYLNHNLLCPNCRIGFYAIEIDPPTSNVHRHRNHPSGGANVSQQGHTKVKRDREEGQASMKREEAIRRKSAPVTAAKRKGIVADMTINGQEKVSGSCGNGTGENGVASSTALKRSGTDIGPDLRQMLMENARMEICSNLEELKLSTVAEARREMEQNGDKKADSNNFEPMDMDNYDAYTMKKSLGDVGIDVPVPDPDFHDFDKDRVEKSITENQIWATYDDSDGMPRRYALIHNVISSDPFKVRIRWLIPKTKHGLLNWVTSGFPVTCGEFTVGRREIINSINSFSHRVQCTKGSNGDIRIFPRKGDVWALYRNWSPDWDELTASEEIHNYDLVEVLEDYDEELGVIIIPLVKVAGFRSMFHHHLDFREVRQIPGEEISRFSHYVPSFLHRGQEALGALKGCKELDPAATPEELLHVVANDEEVILDNGVDV